jgi:hypothetical protein
MKISQIAAATLIPATVAGILATAMPLAEAAPAATVHHAAHHVVHHAAPAKAAEHAKGAKLAKGAEPAKPATHQAVPEQPAAQHATGQMAASSTAQPGSGQASAQTQPATVSQPLTAGMSSFEQCVAWRESTDNPTASSAGLFGILPSTWAQLGYPGTAGQASVALQKVAFSRLYAEYGVQPWAPSDGC